MDSCVIIFNWNYIMPLKQFYNKATKVSSRKKFYYIWWSTWLISMPECPSVWYNMFDRSRILNVFPVPIWYLMFSVLGFPLHTVANSRGSCQSKSLMQMLDSTTISRFCVPSADWRLLIFIVQVKMEMFSSGSSAAFAIFNATGSDKMSWMSSDRLMTSSWDNITEYISIKPVTVSVIGR